MNFSKRGGKNNQDNFSQSQADDNYSNSSRPRKIIQASVSGRSPTNQNSRKFDVDRSTHDSGPEIQFIDNDIDRRNPMMDYNRGTENSFNQRGQNNYNPNRSSILTNLKNDVENPNYRERFEERTREKKKQRTQENSESESSHVSDRRTRNNPSQGTNSIVKKMSPNRNNDMNMDSNSTQNDQNKRSFVRKLSIIADKSNKNPKDQVKPEYSVDTKTRENMRKTYNNDLDAIKAMDLKQNNFKMNNSNVVSKNPQEGKLYARNTLSISAMTPTQIEDQKNNIKRMNKLSTVLIKDNRTRDPKDKEKTIKNNYKEYTEKTLKKAGSTSPGRKNIRSTMSMLASRGPNAEDKIITRQMRFEKGGVVDLAMNPVQNRSAPKKSEVKKTVLRSPKLNNRENRISRAEREKSAQIVQAWWRSMLSKYKEVVDKTVVIQKNWRRYFVRKHLYDKLSYYYYFLFIVDKLENLFRRNNLVYGFSKLYDMNAKNFNAMKVLTSVVLVQRAYRFFKKRKAERKAKLKNLGVQPIRGQVRNRGNNNEDDDNNNDNDSNFVANKPKGRVARKVAKNGNDDGLVGATQNNNNNNNNDPKYDDKIKNLRNTNFRNVLRNFVYKLNNRNVHFFMNHWRNRIRLMNNGKTSDDLIKLLAQQIRNYANEQMRIRLNNFLRNLQKQANANDANNAKNDRNDRDKTDELNRLKNNKAMNEKYNKVLGANAKNLMKKLINRKLFNAFNRWMRLNLLDKKQKNLKPLLQKLFNRTNLNLKFINLAHFFSHWRNACKNTQLDDFRNAMMGKFLKNHLKRRNNKKLLKRFLQWANLAKQGRTQEQNDSIIETKKKQLEAASHLVPLLAQICKKSIARNHGEPIINILRNKNKGSKIRKVFDRVPYFNKFNLKKYFDRFRLRLAEDSGNNLKQKILRDAIRKYVNKDKNKLLQKRLRQWWKQLSNNPSESSDNNPNPIQQLNAVDQLKRALQKRYIKHPVALFKQKVQSDNYDWAGRFALTMKRKVLTGTIREYINRWRNNQLEALVRENMVKFYSGTLLRFNKRYVRNLLRKKFNQWRNNMNLMGTENLNKNVLLMTRYVNGYLFDNSANDKKKLIDELTIKKKNKKYGVALDIMTGMYFANDRKKLGKYFRQWRLDTVKKNLGDMTGRLIKQLLKKYAKFNDLLNVKEKLQKYFDRWKEARDRKNQSMNNLNGFMNRVFNSALFHKRHIRNYIDDILEIAKHFNLMNKKKAQKLGDFMAGLLKVYNRIKLMKRQKVLMETFKKFTFLDRMQIMTALNKWQNRTSKIANIEHADILKDFFRKIVDSQNNKEIVTNKAKATMDNFAKRFALSKLSDTAKLNRIYKILMKLFDSIPKELRKKALMNYCIRWNRNADEIKKANAANMIIKCLKGWIGRRFAYKLLLKKYKREDIARRMFKFLVGQKLFYYSEWKRRARLLELKQNSSAMGIWMNKKFNGFKLLKSRRGLGDLFQKYLNRKMIDALLAAAKVDPHREDKLVGAINKAYLHPPAKKVLKEVKRKYFKKKYGQVFGLMIRKLRHLHVYYYADKWRNMVMDEYYARLIKLQSWVRMVLARLKAKRQLRKQYLTTKFFRKLGLDGNMAIMMYCNIWRAYCKYRSLSDEGEILSKLILFHNANVDYDKDVAQNNLQKIFKNHFIKNIKDAFVDCKNYKDELAETIKGLNNNLEKSYAVNNLVDFGKDSVRRLMLQMIFGVGDRFSEKTKLREAVERWRLLNSRIIEFVIRIQRIWRGKKIRDKMRKLWKVKDIMIRMLIDKFSDKDQIRARTIMWRNRATNLAVTARSNIIQKFLRDHMAGNAKKNLNRIFNNGYRKHFVKCIGDLCKFKRLKDAMQRPWNRQSMDAINKTVKNNKLKDRFRVIMGFSDANNRDWIKTEMIKKWNIIAQRIKEKEMFSALLIVASIRAKLTKIKVRKFQELKSSMRMLLFKAFGDANAMKNFAITQWLNYTRNRMLIENRDRITNHAKEILQKIRDNKDADRKAKFKRAQDIIKKYLGGILLRSHFGLGLENTRNNKLRNLDDIYRNVYRRNVSEGYNRIKWFAIYKENLIKKIQRHWRFYLHFRNLLKKIMIAKNIVKLALDGDLQKKHSHMLFWRAQIQKMNSHRKGTILQNFYRDIMDHLRKKKNSSVNNLADLFKKNILKTKILGPLNEFNRMNKLADIEKIFKKSHLRYLNEKTLLLYMLRLISGFNDKCENKVKQSAMFKFRFNCLGHRDNASKGLILNCLKEVARRRHENKIREIMVKLVKGRSYDDKEIRDKFYCDWSRKAEVLKTKQQADIIGNYLSKQKRKLDLKKKWMNFGMRIAAQNGIYGTRYILDQAQLLRNINPLVNVIYRRNIALNGDDFLNRIRNDNILKLLKRSFAPLMGEKDIYSIILHAKHWNNQAQKLKKRDQVLISLGNNLQNSFNDRAFTLIMNAMKFKYYSRLAEIVQKHNFLSKLKGENEHVRNIEGFTSCLEKSQSQIFDNSTNAFRDKLYKFYVYKILMNMGSNFLKQQQYNKQFFTKDFFEKFKANFAPYKYHCKNLVDKLGPIMDKHNGKIKKNVNGILGFLILEKGLKKNVGRNVFSKFHDTFVKSTCKAKLYSILRQGYLKRQLEVLPKANNFLIFTYISQLYTKNTVAKKIKKISKGFKQWRYKHQNMKMAERGELAINQSMQRFSENIKRELLTGDNSLIKQFPKYQNTEAIKPYILKKAKNEIGKSYVEGLNNKSMRLRTLRTIKPGQKGDHSDEDEYNENSKSMGFNDTGRETIMQAKNAKNNMRK